MHHFLKKNIIIICLFIILLIAILLKLYEKENFDNENINMDKYNDINIEEKIPKIIHQTAPADKSKWKDEWFICQKSWYKYFPEPEYKYIMWTDEDLDLFIKKEYSEFYNIYISYDLNIKRIDIARYFILYKYGGIYADMDYECYENFYHRIPQDKISIVESPYDWEKLQNALMISPKEQKFWLKVIEESKNRTKEHVLDATGPKLISDIYLKNENDINVLPSNIWNPLREIKKNENNKLITKHYGTCTYCNETFI